MRAEWKHNWWDEHYDDYRILYREGREGGGWHTWEVYKRLRPIGFWERFWERKGWRKEYWSVVFGADNVEACCKFIAKNVENHWCSIPIEYDEASP